MAFSFLIFVALLLHAVNSSSPDAEQAAFHAPGAQPHADEVCGASDANPGLTVSIRIEGETATFFEGPIFTTGHNVTTASGGNHHCDGTNFNASQTPGPTCTGALDDASHVGYFTWDGPYFPKFDDYFITRIADNSNTSTEDWAALLNWELITVGGCQQKVTETDKILWAYNGFHKQNFLELTGPGSVGQGQPITVFVTNGSNGVPIPGASVGGQTTNDNGTATLTFQTSGLYLLKAEETDSIRSNVLEVIVI